MIARIWQDGKYKFICYVFESETSGKEVGHFNIFNNYVIIKFSYASLLLMPLEQLSNL